MNDDHERRFAYQSDTLPTFLYLLMSAIILGLLAASFLAEGWVRVVTLVPVPLLGVVLWSGHRVASLDKDGARAVVLGPELLEIPKPMSRGTHQVPLVDIEGVRERNGNLEVIHQSGRVFRIPGGLVEERSLEVLRRELVRRIDPT